MDFQTVIFNRFKKLFVEDTSVNVSRGESVYKDVKTKDKSKELSKGVEAPKEASASETKPGETKSKETGQTGIKSRYSNLSDGKKAAVNIGVGLGGVGAVTATGAGINSALNSSHDAGVKSANAAHAADAAETATKVAAKHAVDSPSGAALGEKGANAYHAIKKTLGSGEDAAKNIAGHGLDTISSHAGPALAAGAIGTAAWMARRRALKNVSRGL